MTTAKIQGPPSKLMLCELPPFARFLAAHAPPQSYALRYPDGQLDFVVVRALSKQRNRTAQP